MASRRKKKLDVEETTVAEEEGSKIKFEEACVLVTTVTLICGIVVIFIMLGGHYGIGPLAG